MLDSQSIIFCWLYGCKCETSLPTLPPTTVAVKAVATTYKITTTTGLIPTSTSSSFTQTTTAAVAPSQLTISPIPKLSPPTAIKISTTTATTAASDVATAAATT